MPRDSILDDAEQSEENNENGSRTDSGSDTGTEDDSGGDNRVRVTQRIPQDLADDIDRVQEEYSLPSRNATINFMLKHASKDL
ncbi:hypothetical protein C491_21101 [Natronococcus amylolyticus DSM 10524]|uniref:Uncharacterized protein n=1 Tax=Natronococcus amylolyticus DSM 10524 TaxID=1227497 RepID=L9WVI5_9EURY|nr:hypothetical protein [Natronococcus amylolyticus]ELY53427.1 hypothetical protein C491_21101 [Natronococcus amylolyticus DSM 10524]